MRPHRRLRIPGRTSSLSWTAGSRLPARATLNCSGPVSCQEVPARMPRLLARISIGPRPAATVVLARPSPLGGAGTVGPSRGPRPWQALLMRRPGGAEFAPGAYVFPGGSVHREDQAFPDEVRAAAVRELFEEVGVL